MWTETPAGSSHLDWRRLCGRWRGRLVDVDAELVLAEAGGDVGVGFGEDVGVDAEGEAGGLPEEFGAGGEEVKFGGRFDIEEEDSGVEGGVDLGNLLAYPGEYGRCDCGLCGFDDSG